MKAEEKKNHKNNTVPTLWLMGPQEEHHPHSLYTLYHVLTWQFMLSSASISLPL